VVEDETDRGAGRHRIDKPAWERRYGLGEFLGVHRLVKLLRTDDQLPEVTVRITRRRKLDPRKLHVHRRLVDRLVLAWKRRDLHAQSLDEGGVLGGKERVGEAFQPVNFS